MAGDIEEPFNINFQGNSILSGSISFGRYENDSLSWERRSTFSHNRYLEDVEKYSKPGSVNEKKAYFEAHFKKKGGLLTPETCNGLVNQRSVNSASEDQAEDFEAVHKENHNGHSDDSSDSPESQADHDVIESEMQNRGVAFTDTKSGASLGSASCLIDGALRDVNADIRKHGDSEGNTLNTFVGDEPGIEMKHDINNIVFSEIILTEALDSNPKNETVIKTGKSSSGSQQTPSLKVTKETNASKSQVNISGHTRRNISCDAFKSAEKLSKKSNRGHPQMICTQEHSSKSATISTHPVRGTPNVEDSKVLKGKAILESRSGEKVRTLRESHSSSLTVVSRPHQKATRHNRTINSAMQDTGKRAPALNLRSIESTVRRKLHPKLDTVHNKEADRFKSHARTQVDAEAETKKFPKKLDIRSKPIPSSSGGIRPESDGKKIVVTSTKVRNTSRKSSALGISSHFPLGRNTETFASESLNTSKNMSCHTGVHVEARGNTNPSVPSTNEELLPETENSGKKGQTNVKDSNVQKPRVLENCRADKGQGVGRNQKVGAQKSLNLMGRKDIKSVAGSAMGQRVVGVTL